MLNRKFNLLLATILLSSSSVVLADTCPTPETVKDRKISRVMPGILMNVELWTMCWQ
ncbi:MAG: hypothetical protein RLT30_03340 [Gammaproteobacteria bacterium]